MSRMPGYYGQNATRGFDTSYRYKYPDGRKLKPGSELHDTIVQMLLDRAQESYDQISSRFDSWDEIGKTLRAYVSPDQKDDEDAVGDQTNSIVIPVSYANMETVLTYMTKTFLGDSIFRFSPVGPEDELGSRLMELLVQRQMVLSGAGLELHTSWRDGFAYGFGAAVPVWTEHYAYKRQFKEEGFLSMINSLFQSSGIRETTDQQLVREGNEIITISPYRTLPDPTVAIHKVQKGEFFGWTDSENFASLMARDQGNGGDLFNVKYLRHMNGGMSAFSSFREDSGDRDAAADDSVREGSVTRPFDIVYMYVNLIPEEWGLGKGEYPEKWMFGVAGDRVLIKAEPAGLDHGKFPVSICAPDYDGYSASPISRMELVNGMQQVVDFVINSHIANVRKAVNDMLIVDPLLVNMDDLANPKPGKLIRLRQRGWGRGVENVVKQLQVSDVTRGNVQDAGFIMNMIQQTTGAVDVVQGLMKDRGERRSATEVNTARSSALSRLEKTAQIISMQMMQPLGGLIASQTQQLMSEETFVKIAGRYREELAATYGQEYANVTPQDISVNFDVEISDGSMPGGEPPETWVNLFQVLGQNEMLSQQFDMVRIFKHIARQLGAKNVEQFALKPPQQGKLMEDDQLLNEIDKGNLIERGQSATP